MKARERNRKAVKAKVARVNKTAIEDRGQKAEDREQKTFSKTSKGKSMTK